VVYWVYSLAISNLISIVANSLPRQTRAPKPNGMNELSSMRNSSGVLPSQRVGSKTSGAGKTEAFWWRAMVEAVMRVCRLGG